LANAKRNSNRPNAHGFWIAAKHLPNFCTFARLIQGKGKMVPFAGDFF
jgi:hypothetical protein